MFPRSSTPTSTSGTAMPAASSNNFPRTPKFDLLRNQNKSILMHVLRCRPAFRRNTQRREVQVFHARPCDLALCGKRSNKAWEVSRCSIGPASHFLDGYRDDRLV